MRKMMEKYAVVLLLAGLTMFLGCDVHEWPDPKKQIEVCLDVEFDTQMTMWNHLRVENDVEEVSLGPTYDHTLPQGAIRYTVRAYELDGNGKILPTVKAEKSFVRDVADGYECKENIIIPPGNYKIMVWADFLEPEREEYFYNVDSFEAVQLLGKCTGCNDYRDAYRGIEDALIETDIIDRAPDTLKIHMERPMAKIEIVSTDLMEFVNKEHTRMSAVMGEQGPVKVRVEDYKIVCHYVGYLGSTYSLLSDATVYSEQGARFNSTIQPISDQEASLAFDYVYADEERGYVTLQIALYSKDDDLLAMSSSVVVPIKRDHHTVVRSKFLTTKESGGIGVDPGYDDEFNIVL